MKLNLKIFKKNTFYWVIGAIILFAIFFYFASKGGWGSSGDTTSATTVADPTVDPATQLAYAQLSSQTQIAQAQINQQANSDTLGANTQVALASLAAGVQTTEDQLGYNATLASIQSQQTMNAQNNQYSIDSAKVAAENNVDLATISRQAQADILNQQILLNGQNTNLLAYQLQTNASMFSQQLAASTEQTALSTLPNLYDNAPGHTTDALKTILATYASTNGGLGGGGPAIVPVTLLPSSNGTNP